MDSETREALLMILQIVDRIEARQAMLGPIGPSPQHFSDRASVTLISETDWERLRHAAEEAKRGLDQAP